MTMSERVVRAHTLVLEHRYTLLACLFTASGFSYLFLEGVVVAVLVLLLQAVYLGLILGSSYGEERARRRARRAELYGRPRT